MAGDDEAFVDELRKTIEARRTFGRHPLWLRIQQGRLPPQDLRTFAVQFFLQVREFPRAVSALHSRCPFPEERVKLAESLYEEETGRISGCNVAHPELFIRFGEAVGAPRDAMVGGEALPGTAALIDWDIHEAADREHSDIGDHIVVRFATSEEWHATVRRAVKRSLDLWWQFFDDIERAISAGPTGSRTG